MHLEHSFQLLLTEFIHIACPWCLGSMELEEKRKERAQVTYERKKQLTKLRVKAEKAAEEKLGPQSDILAVVKY
nr:60s ribosomal protein l13a-4 [Quercus suber]